MKFWMLRRPLYLFALTVFFAVFTLVSVGEQYGLQVALVAMAVFLPAVFVPSLRRISAVMVIALAVLVGSLVTYARFWMVVRPLRDLNEMTTQVLLRIDETPAEDGVAYRATVLESDLLPTGTKLRVSVADRDVYFERFERVQGVVSVYDFSDNQRFLQSDNIFITGYFHDPPTSIGVENSTPAAWIYRLRERMLDGIRAYLPGTSGRLVAGICLGEVSALPVQLETDFRVCGLTHLLVVSGLHMTVLTGALFALLRRLRAGRIGTLLITLAFLWLFMLLVGFSCSVVRAGVMLHFLLIGQSLRVRADTRTSLAAALLLIILQNPYAVQDVGFLLSFASTLGLIVLTPPITKLADSIPLLHRCAVMKTAVIVLCTPLMVMVFTAPILVYAFGCLSVVCVPANLLVGWPTTVLLCLGMLGAVCSCIPLFGWLAQGLLFAAGLLAKWVIEVAGFLASLPISQLFIRHNVIFLLALLLPFGVYWAWKLFGIRGLWRAGAAGVAALMIGLTAITAFGDTMSFMRVHATEDGFVILTETPIHTAVVMSGNGYGACADARRFLLSCGLRRVDTLVVTAGDETSTAGLAELTEAVRVGTMVYPRQTLDMTAGIGGVRRVQLEEIDSFDAADAVCLEKYADWWRLAVADTRLLLAPSDGDVKTLPAEWTETHLAIFYHDVPKRVSLLTVQRAVAICDTYILRFVTGDLPWGSYPIHLTATDGDIVLCTTGEGNATLADRYFL